MKGRWTTALLIAAALLGGCDDGRAVKAQAAPADPASAASHVVAMARAVVEVPGGLTEVMAPQDGVVASVAVQEGETVRAGQVLLRLSAEQQQQDLALARADLQVAQARERAHQSRLPAAQRQAQRMAAAVRADVLDAQQAEAAQQSWQDLQADAAVAKAEVVVAQQRLAQVQAQSRRLVVTAAQAGTVVRLQVQPGMRVSMQGGHPLMVLLPARALRLRAEVNEAFAARIVPGMRASVRLDADAEGPPLPGAHVVRLAPMFGSSRLDDDASTRRNSRVVECFLEFDSPPTLRIGQSVRVEFHD